jgi:UDP-glucuronate 4-epimerase
MACLGKEKGRPNALICTAITFKDTNNSNDMKVLVTGTAGFIGFHLANRMMGEDVEIIGLDSINDYYDVSLKHSRLALHGIDASQVKYGEIIKSTKYPNYSFVQLKLEDIDGMRKLFDEQKFDAVAALAAQAGVRYSLENPHSYITSNVNGFMNVLEGCRYNNVKHLVYASTSSVYGLNTAMPFKPSDSTNHPMTLYAATKKSNEMMAHSYSHLFSLPTTGLRFFTVYGPWGRPDMALFKFTKATLDGQAIDVYNNGNMVRDFTYVGDIVENIFRLLPKPPQPNKEWDSADPVSSLSSAPYRILNIGNSSPVPLLDYIEAMEDALGMKAKRNMLPMQPGDVPATYANVDDLEAITDFRPRTTVKEGVKNFIDWYKMYYKVEAAEKETAQDSAAVK